MCMDGVWIFFSQDWIMEQWEKNYYISSIAGATNGSSLVVMSKGLTIYPHKFIYVLVKWVGYMNYSLLYLRSFILFKYKVL